LSATRYCLDNSPGGLGFNVAWTLLVKVESNHACTQFDTGSCVSYVRDAADFDLHRSHDGENDEARNDDGRINDEARMICSHRLCAVHLQDRQATLCPEGFRGALG
jgi:hypothetical protein